MGCIKDAKRFAISFQNEFAPRLAILLLLLPKVGGELLDAIMGHAGDVLLRIVRLSQADGDGQGGRHVDIADASVRLCIVESELDESEVDVCVGPERLRPLGSMRAGLRRKVSFLPRAI
jgi:hypothetical protein